MNNHISQNNIAGLIEYRGEIMAAHIPVPLLIFDAVAYALTRIRHNRTEALDPDYTVEERAERRRRADAIEAWTENDYMGNVAFQDDTTLYARSAFTPTIVTCKNLNTYLDTVLAVNTVVPTDSMDAPQFLIRSSDCRPELWLVDTHKLRAPRLHSSPEIMVVEASVYDLKAIIASQ